MRLAALLLMGLAASAGAVMPNRAARRDAARFRLSAARETPTVSAEAVDRAVKAYNGRRGAAALGVGQGGRFTPQQAAQTAQSFLAQTQAQLGVDPLNVKTLRQISAQGQHHLLYQQTYKGLPVEFSRVKVHLDDAGQVIGAQSRFRPRLAVDVRPTVAESVAAYAAKQDAGHEPRSAGELVIFVDPASGEPSLAWKFTILAGGLWRYYVDAHTGAVLFRYDDRRYVCAGTQGTVRALVFDQDFKDTTAVIRNMPNQYVYIRDAGSPALTASDGTYCSSNVGKVFATLQGPYVRVSNFKGPSSFYNNGQGTWNTVPLVNAQSFAQPVSSPHPYSNNAVHVSTVDISNAALYPSAVNAVMSLPVFSSFDVGQFTGSSLEGGDITDDDQVAVLDSSGSSVAAYVGARGAFNGAAVAGKKIRLSLKSNATGAGNGYDVASSSFLVLSNPTVEGVATPGAATADSGSFDWYPTSYSAGGFRGEINLFYHLNKMHDFFSNGVDASGIAPLTPLAAMNLVGPNLVNAFYDPDYDDILFGDLNGDTPNDIFANDATVSRHEYTHYVVEKIWPIQNFGQAGAISEAVADYFSATSLNQPAIGRATNEALQNVGPIRNLDCVPNDACFRNLSTNGWTGEIHDDSLNLSQALWSLRKDRVTDQGAANGAACVDGLVFQSLLFFPESFDEMLTAMTKADTLGLVPVCATGSAECAGNPKGCVAQRRSVAAFFADHGIPVGSGSNDPYDMAGRHNDGFETAIDVSTLPSVSATIYPAADLDFYTFSAGPGPVTVTVSLPPDGFFHKAYSVSLFDRSHKDLVDAVPNLGEGQSNNTDGVSCLQEDCQTIDNQVSLTYVNPTSNQFFVEVAGGPTADGSNSRVNSTVPYVLKARYTAPGAVTGTIVSAKVDGDVISFSVPVTSYTTIQDYRFAYAQLRDHALVAVPYTLTHVPATAGDYLLFLSSSNGLGQISGKVQLASGFNSRFPAVGTVELEVFGYNVAGSTVSLGLSNPIALTSSAQSVKALNNVFNPLRGEKTTIRVDVQSGGHVTAKLYTMTGVLVATVFDGTVQAGKTSVDWDGHNLSGMVVSSGVYLLKVEGPGISSMKKVAVIK